MIVENVVGTKGFYRFVEFVSKLCGGSLPHERYKLISLDEVEALSGEEVEAKKLADSYSFALSNVFQPFDTVLLERIYFLLSGLTLSKESAEAICEEYYLHKDEDPHYVAMKVHICVLKKVPTRKIEFAFSVSNMILLKRGLHQMIPRGSVHGIYMDCVNANKENKLMYLFSQMKEPSDEGGSMRCAPEGIAGIISAIKPKIPILESKFAVRKLLLYGSVAKGVVTKQSDVDFLVQFDPSEIPLERQEKKNKLIGFLSTLLGTRADVIDFTNALRNLDISEMENSIALI